MNEGIMQSLKIPDFSVKIDGCRVVQEKDEQSSSAAVSTIVSQKFPDAAEDMRQPKNCPEKTEEVNDDVGADDRSRHVSSESKKGHQPISTRRKISLPWFRQHSFGMGLARLRLPKQHTVASLDSGLGKDSQLGGVGSRSSSCGIGSGGKNSKNSCSDGMHCYVRNYINVIYNMHLKGCFEMLG